jgi:hypothetical protein
MISLARCNGMKRYLLPLFSKISLALQCIITLERYQEHGLNSDQGREAAQQLITDSLDLGPND